MRKKSLTIEKLMWKINVSLYGSSTEAIVGRKTRATAVLGNKTKEFISLSGKGTQTNKTIY